MTEAIAAALVFAPLVMGIVELGKRSGIPDRLAPIFALISGIAMALLVAWSRVVDELRFANLGLVILTGIVAGLSAAGVYSGVKAVRTG